MDDVKPLKRVTGNPYAGLKFHKKTSTATLLQGVNKRAPGPTFPRMDGNEPNHYQQPGANGFNTVIPLTPASRPLPDIPSDRQAVSALNVKIETSPCDTPTAKSTSSPGKRRSVASTLASASKRKKLNNVPRSRQHKPDGMGWSIVKSVTHPTSSASEPAATNPRQWLESREDLYSMALSRLSMCNGISMTDASKVVVVVDQESGINLSLESNILEWALSIKREFLHHPPQSSERAIYSVPSLGTEGKTPVTFQTSALRSSGTPLREHSHDGSGTLPNAPNAQMEDRPAVTSHALSMVSVSPSGRYPSIGLSHPAPPMQVVRYPNINGFREKQVDPIASQRSIPPYKSNLAHHWSNRPSGSASLGPNGNTIQGGTYTEPPLEPQSTKNISSNNSQLLVNNYPTNDVRSPLEEETITQDLFWPSVGIFPSNLNALVTLPSYVKAPNKSATMITDFPAFLDARLVHDALQPPVVAPKIFTARTLTPEMPPYALAPVEVCQLLDALRFELPIVLIASHDSLQNVGVKLDPKFAYSVAGCFQVKQVQNQRRVPTDAIPPTYMESEWKFVIRWIPGGETSFCPYNTHLYSPWWSPTNNSTHDPDNSPDVLPSDLVGDRRSEATGWHCSSCGKVNHQMLFRHLRCSSSFCKNEPAKPLQPITLAQIIKNPQDKLGMAKPSHLKFNAHVQGHYVTWEDGMQTFKYQIRDTSTFCSHVFTGNAGELQDEASTLFRDIQTEIQLTFDGIYFTHSQTDAVSEKAPKSLKDAQDWLMHTVKTYSDIADVDNLLRLRTLSVMAWWKEGKRRTASQLQAKSQPVALACFGNSLTITLTRQSSIKTPTRKPRFGGAPSGPSPASATSEKQEPMDVFGPTISTQQDITAIPAEDFVVSMVHGDVLCVFGDDFEYNLKRNGTGMFLIGTS